MITCKVGNISLFVDFYPKIICSCCLFSTGHWFFKLIFKNSFSLLRILSLCQSHALQIGFSNFSFVSALIVDDSSLCQEHSQVFLRVASKSTYCKCLYEWYHSWGLLWPPHLKHQAANKHSPWHIWLLPPHSWFYFFSHGPFHLFTYNIIYFCYLSVFTHYNSHLNSKDIQTFVYFVYVHA